MAASGTSHAARVSRPFDPHTHSLTALCSGQAPWMAEPFPEGVSRVTSKLGLALQPCAEGSLIKCPPGGLDARSRLGGVPRADNSGTDGHPSSLEKTRRANTGSNSKYPLLTESFPHGPIIENKRPSSISRTTAVAYRNLLKHRRASFLIRVSSSVNSVTPTSVSLLGSVTTDATLIMRELVSPRVIGALKIERSVITGSAAVDAPGWTRRL
jgi:hypothetical protein